MYRSKNIKMINLKKKDIENILIKINPKIKSYIKNKKINLTDNGLLDSLMIIRMIAEIESITKKKIKISKVDRKTFSNIDSIMKFLSI
jgi:acyl carrier protein